MAALIESDIDLAVCSVAIFGGREPRGESKSYETRYPAILRLFEIMIAVCCFNDQLTGTCDEEESGT